jgi:hypothetical protein
VRPSEHSQRIPCDGAGDIRALVSCEAAPYNAPKLGCVLMCVWFHQYVGECGLECLLLSFPGPFARGQTKANRITGALRHRRSCISSRP